MLEASDATGQWYMLLPLAVALGMDAFSLGVGIGLRGVRLADVLRLGLVVTLFHFLMPMGGMIAGQYVRSLLEDVAKTAAGALLLFLGAHMIYSAFRGGGGWTIDHRSVWGMLLFALGVSIDSFSVGLSLGMCRTERLLLATLLFGLAGGTMNVAGLLAGRRAARLAGGYGEALGGVILFGFGLLFLF